MQLPLLPLLQLRRDLRSEFEDSSPVLRWRLAGGLFRNLNKLQNMGLDPFRTISATREQELGFQSGWGGSGGWPGLWEFIVASSENHGRIGRHRLVVEASETAFSGGRNYAVSPEIKHELKARGVQLQAEGALTWKNLTCQGRLDYLRDALDGYEKVFLGPRRSRPFAASLAVKSSEFVEIPDHSSYTLVPEIVDRMEEILGSGSSNRKIVLHSASLAGNLVSAHLAERGNDFLLMDLGLAGAVFDIEYLANRPWFNSCKAGVLKSKSRLARKGKVGWVGNASHSAETRAATALRVWPDLRRDSVAQPEEATRKLEQLVTAVRGQLNIELLESVLLIWQHFHLNQVDEGLLARCSRGGWKSEPLLAASCIEAARGNLSGAMRLVEEVEKSNSWDTRPNQWRSLILAANSSRSVVTEVDWRQALTQPGREDLGSSLSWSLDGDWPSGKR